MNNESTKVKGEPTSYIDIYCLHGKVAGVPSASDTVYDDIGAEHSILHEEMRSK